MGFSDQLKAARMRSGYTQQDIADMMGISKSTYCGYETGKRQPDVEKIKRLASILNTTGDDLLETGVTKSKTDELSEEEVYLLKAFRSLDGHGKHMVFVVADLEAARCVAEDDPFADVDEAVREQTTPRPGRRATRDA